MDKFEERAAIDVRWTDAEQPSEGVVDLSEETVASGDGEQLDLGAFCGGEVRMAAKRGVDG
jgi:hypothetical protein